jgi:hypothetical protein
MTHDGNHIQQSAERRRNPDLDIVEIRQYDVRRAVSIVERTARIRGVTPESMKQPSRPPETSQMGGNIVNAAARFAHERQVALEEAEAQQLAAAREAVDEAQRAA